MATPTAYKPVRIYNAKALAIGTRVRGGFVARKVVWGWLMARMEKRTGEKIVRVVMAERPPDSWSGARHKPKGEEAS